MSTTIPQITTPEELRSIAENAVALLEAFPSPLELDVGSEESRRWNVAFEVAKDALRFCARAMWLSPDAGLLPWLVDGFDLLAHWSHDGARTNEIISHAITCILEAGALITDTVTDLAAHPSPEVRKAVASGLSPANPRAVALLQKLAVDPIADVRKPAVKALGDVPWWLGKFDMDPVARLSASEAEHHKDTFEKLTAMLDGPRDRLVGRDEELANLVATLPDPLAVEVARIVVAGGGERTRDFTRLGAMMIARPGGIDAFLRVIEAWAERPHFHAGDAQVQMVSTAPREVCIEACLALARWAMAGSRVETEGEGHAPTLAAQIAAKAFPLDADATVIFDFVTAEGDDDGSGDRVARGLNEIWRRKGLDITPFADRLIAARLAGFPGRFRHILDIESHLDSLPRETLRWAAAEAIGKDDVGTVRWGIEKMLFEAHDPARDPDPMDLVRRFWGEPRFREAILSDYRLSKVAVSLLRPALRSGDLSFADVTRAVDVIRALWPSGEPRNDERYAAFLGPPDLQGAMTDAEWDIVRRARAGHVPSGFHSWAAALDAIPDGPWHPEDWAFVEGAVRAAEEGKADIVYLVAMALRQKPCVESISLFERLSATDHEQAVGMRTLLREMREKLGIVVERAAESKAATTEWMDEEEEDEDEDD